MTVDVSTLYNVNCHVAAHTLYTAVTLWNTYLLTPCSKALLEKLTGLQLVKKFLAFYGTRRFVTAFTNA
jgi:hypothetical protein